MMKSVLVAAAALSGLSLAVTTDCNANNCLRAVRATQRATRFGLDDCFSYLKTTVTPATSTVTETETETVTETPTVYLLVTESRLVIVTATEVESRTYTSFTSITRTTLAPVAKRQATEIPSLIPAYASACSGSAKYSSACLCIGATASTVTAAAPLTTVTETETETVSPVTVSVPTTVSTVSITTTGETTTLTATVTTVGATETAVRTVTAPPQCVSLVARNLLYTFGAPGRLFGTYSQTIQYPLDDESRTLCCAWCYSIPDCSIFFFSNTGNGQAVCQPFINTDSVPQNQNAQCPLGITNGVVDGSSSSGFGLGPCYRL